jgi:hypothetical protein
MISYCTPDAGFSDPFEQRPDTDRAIGMIGMEVHICREIPFGQDPGRVRSYKPDIRATMFSNHDDLLFIVPG